MSIDISKLESSFAIEEAAILDKVAVEPGLDQLQVDIDGQDKLDAYERGVKTLSQRYKVLTEVRLPSKTAGHWHITIQLEVGSIPDVPTRLLLQACLGSDLTRELLSWFRFCDNDEHPSLLIVEQTSVRVLESIGSKAVK